MPIDLAALREWLGVPATQIDDEALQQVVDAELLVQSRLCTVPLDESGERYLTADLAQAIYRRVGRHLAAKDSPLGVLGVETEFGPARLALIDAEIERLEAPNRRVVLT